MTCRRPTIEKRGQSYYCYDPNMDLFFRSNVGIGRTRRQAREHFARLERKSIRGEKAAMQSIRNAMRKIEGRTGKHWPDMSIAEPTP